ncbi:MAG: hypothetical protein R2754_01395 [Microthrixaceae bacterium]
MRIRRSLLVGVAFSVLIGVGLSFSPVGEWAADAFDKVAVTADEANPDGADGGSRFVIRGIESDDIDRSLVGVATLLGLFAGAAALIGLVVKVSLRF